MTCGGCNLIEVKPVTAGSVVRCKGCPDVDARILWGMDLFGRRAMLATIGEQRGEAHRKAVEDILRVMWKDRKDGD